MKRRKDQGVPWDEQVAFVRESWQKLNQNKDGLGGLLDVRLANCDIPPYAADSISLALVGELKCAGYDVPVSIYKANFPPRIQIGAILPFLVESSSPRIQSFGLLVFAVIELTGLNAGPTLTEQYVPTGETKLTSKLYHPDYKSRAGYYGYGFEGLVPDNE